MNPKNAFLLNVTKFLVKISQFEFLVMTDPSILVYILFLSLNIPYFLSKNCPLPSPPEKSHPLILSDPPVKAEVLPSPPFLKVWSEFHPHPSPPTPSRNQGACYEKVIYQSYFSEVSYKIILLFIFVIHHLRLHNF